MSSPRNKRRQVILNAVVPRDFPQRTSYYAQLNHERMHSPEACDILLNTSDGKSLAAHKEVLCENCDFFRVMFSSRFIECRENQCRLQTVDEPTLQLVLDYLYGKDLYIPDDMVLAVFAASHFLSLAWLNAYCAASIARRPFETTLEHATFLDLVRTRGGIVDIILDFDLLLTDNVRLHNLTSTWPIDEDGRLRTIATRLRKKAGQRREMAVIFERSVGYAVTFTGNRTQQWLEQSGFQISLKSQHIAIATDQIYYATGWVVGVVGNDDPVYKEPEGCGVIWPPLLRKYGANRVIWTEGNRRTLCRRSLTNSAATKERFSFQTDSMVRHIASTDSLDYDHITVVVTTKGNWEVRRKEAYRAVSNEFVNLNCPLTRVECAAILLDRLYVIGSWTANSVPKTMLAYNESDKSWVTLCDRKRELVPGAFLPLNGRLYIITCGLPTVEVYEPTVDSWMLDELHEFVHIGGFSIVCGQS